MPLTRRDFAALPPAPPRAWHRAHRQRERAARHRAPRRPWRQRHAAAAGYGPLVPDPAGILALPEGFEYKIIARAGSRSSTAASPRRPTTTARRRSCATAARHPARQQPRAQRQRAVPRPAARGLVYDPAAAGGCTVVEVAKTATGRPVRRYRRHATNCAGGTHPLGHLAHLRGDRGKPGKPHGYVLRGRPVRPAAPTATPSPSRRSAATRTRRWSSTPEHALYLTEDADTPNGLLYRWTPPHGLPPGAAAAHARRRRGRARGVQVLRLRRQFVDDLSLPPRPARVYGVDWVEVPDRDATDGLGAQAVHRRPDHPRPQARGHVVGRRRRLLRLLVRPQTDGSAGQHDGQVWFYDPRDDTIELKLLFAYTPSDQDSARTAPTTSPSPPTAA